ncbi:MAG: NADH-quinone oxidoreductase subunit H [Anaerolineae bacterium]|jgi:NADH-quinone oxidoreductase subunit H
MIEALVKSVVIFVVMLTGLVYVAWVERKVTARFLNRRGLDRVGPLGLFQPLADGLKLIFKQELTPAQEKRHVFVLAPILALLPLLLIWAVVPLGGIEIAPGLADVNVGVLYVLAMMAVATYSVVLAGWACDSRQALWGGLRALVRGMSWQLPLALSIAGVLLLSGSMSLNDIVERQREGGVWFVFLQPLASLIFLIVTLVESHRMPFDLPQAETSAYYAEYAGVKFALFFMAGYAKTVVVSALAVTLFFGGWLPPFPNLLRGLWEAVGGLGWLSPLWFGGKVLAWLVALVWMRVALPRLRHDQVMRLSWKFLLPLAFLNLVLTAGLMVLLDV